MAQTGSNQIEIHALSAASGYQAWIEHVATAQGPGPANQVIGRLAP